jgi:hypothetical protein
MWVLDRRSGIVNLDNAVWVGITSPPISDERTEDGAEAFLKAHMIDGTSITLEAGTESAVALRLHALAQDLVDHRPMAGVRELGSRVRHED